MRTTDLIRWIQQKAKNMGMLGACLVMGAAGAAVVSASIPGPDGVIKGCVKANGDVKIIDSAATCPSSQQTLNWNQTGPAGSTGPTGPQGPAGSGSVLINNLTGADLRGAVMVGWNLSGTDFSNANLAGIRLTGSNLTGANFSGVSLARASLEGAKFAGVTLSGATFMQTTFGDGDFTGADLSGTHFNSVSGTFAGNNNGGNFTNADFTGAVMNSSWYADNVTPNFDVVNPNFSGANFTNVAFTPPINGFALVFDNANFSNANFTGASFNGTPQRNVRFQTANFTGADLSGVTMTNIAWDNTICPDGTNSNSHGNTCVGHLAP